ARWTLLLIRVMVLNHSILLSAPHTSRGAFFPPPSLADVIGARDRCPTRLQCALVAHLLHSGDELGLGAIARIGAFFIPSALVRDRDVNHAVGVGLSRSSAVSRGCCRGGCESLQCCDR